MKGSNCMERRRSRITGFRMIKDHRVQMESYHIDRKGFLK